MKAYGLVASLLFHLIGIVGFVVVESSTISAKTSLSSLKVNIFTKKVETDPLISNSLSQPINKPTTSESGVEEAETAKLVSDLEPEYPWVSRINKEEGLVRLNVTLDTNGHPSLVEVIQSSGHKRLDESAVIAAKQAQYLNKSEKEVLIQLNLNFELKKKN